MSNTLWFLKLKSHKDLSNFFVVKKHEIFIYLNYFKNKELFDWHTKHIKKLQLFYTFLMHAHFPIQNSHILYMLIRS